ncbi:MAG: hypothetical protein OXR72_09950 [Gemmatimonadota bacterium]|nr:hypothetical protein [Gemmatimonadota bacterium]
MEIPGWGAWSWAVGSQMLLKNAANEAVRVMCVLDSDYHTPNQIANRKLKAEKKGVWLHIWAKKEIENYLLVPEAIARNITNSVRNGTSPPTAKMVESRLEAEAVALTNKITDGFSQEFYTDDRDGGLSRSNENARELIKRKRIDGVRLIDLAPGKELFSRLSAWAQTEYGVSFSATSIARTIHRQELSGELCDVIREIEEAGTV